MALNAMTVSAGTALDVLRTAWAAQKAGHLTAAYMLHGAPGVGKTEIIQQLADEIGARLFDLRLTTIEPQDLRGLPYYDHDAQKTIWYRPEDLPDDPATPSVLFLDELTAAAPNLQPTVYGLLQERRVGQHRLPDNVFLVAAGNTVEDGAIAYEMGSALSDRLVHLHVVASASDWLENYAIPHNLHPAVIAFLRSRGDLLSTVRDAQERDDVIAATPRAWARVSAILRATSERRLRNILVAGTVGEAIGAEFALVADEVAATVRIDELLRTEPGKRLALYPNSMHGLHALVYGLIGALTAETAPGIIACMADLTKLADKRPESIFRTLPLEELRTHGFELLIQRGLALDLADSFLDSPAYADYARQREEAGLA
ncbi:AAA family ATPase [Dinoroseobacter sp. S76]|uniref:AAA family ATPase n=1 Tax=Dinoroseobacter sp. S76 TaxID=3415124 RepID=UPI003C7D1279